jgi:acyl-CoA thioesterase-1
MACGSKKDGERTSAAARRDSSATRADAQVSPASGRKTVMFIGTSLTAGLGLDPEDAFPQLLAQKMDSLGMHYEVVNAGLSGETSAGALRRVDWLLRGPADVVVLETGANDGLRGLDVDSTEANIRALVKRIRATRPRATILLVQMEAPPNFGVAYTTAFRSMYERIAREDGLILMPFLLDKVAGIGRLNQGDGIHPNEEGERIVAASVWRSLKPVLDSLDRP